jgi:hypothetical protein
VAAVATLFYVVNVGALSAAIAGLPHPLATVLLLLAVWLLFLDPQLPAAASAAPEAGDEATARPASGLAPWRLALGGVVCAAAVLTDYALLPFAFVLALYLAWTEVQRWQAAGIFAGGFVAATVPWLWRSYALGGSPLVNLNWYEALANTKNYPGGSVWRFMELPDHPLRFALVHPLQTMRKAATGFAAFWGQGAVVATPLVAFLFLAATFGSVGTSRWMRQKAAILVGIALCILAAAPLRPEPLLLLDFTPLLCIAAAQALVAWLPQRLGAWTLGERRIGENWTRGLAWTGILLLAVFPLLYFILVTPPASPSGLRDRYEVLKQQIPQNAKVLTDQPAALAWYADRRGIWLPQREEDLDILEKNFGSMDAAYVSPAIGSLPVAEWGNWWTWVITPQGVYRGLVTVAGTNSTGILRLQRREGSR